MCLCGRYDLRAIHVVFLRRHNKQFSDHKVWLFSQVCLGRWFELYWLYQDVITSEVMSSFLIIKKKHVWGLPKALWGRTICDRVKTTCLDMLNASLHCFRSFRSQQSRTHTPHRHSILLIPLIQTHNTVAILFIQSAQRLSVSIDLTLDNSQTKI